MSDLGRSVATLEEANVEREGRINDLEAANDEKTALIESMSSKLCRCNSGEVVRTSGAGSPEDPIEIEDEELEYASPEEYVTPPIAAVVTELVPIDEVDEEVFHLEDEVIPESSSEGETVVDEEPVQVPPPAVSGQRASRGRRGTHYSMPRRSILTSGHRSSYHPYRRRAGSMLDQTYGLPSTDALARNYFHLCRTGGLPSPDHSTGSSSGSSGEEVAEGAVADVCSACLDVPRSEGVGERREGPQGHGGEVEGRTLGEPLPA
jgi:hypothetical protein